MSAEQDRQDKLRALKQRQDSWMQQRQAERDREAVVAQLYRPPVGPANVSSDTTSASCSSSDGISTTPCRVDQELDQYQRSKSTSLFVGDEGVRAEEVIDKLTERITHRLRDELRVEMQEVRHDDVPDALRPDRIQLLYSIVCQLGAQDLLSSNDQPGQAQEITMD